MINLPRSAENYLALHGSLANQGFGVLNLGGCAPSRRCGRNVGCQAMPEGMMCCSCTDFDFHSLELARVPSRRSLCVGTGFFSHQFLPHCQLRMPCTRFSVGNLEVGFSLLSGFSWCQNSCD